MKYLILIAASLAAAGCCRKPIQSSTERDSIRIVHRKEYIDKLRDTVIYVEIPIEVKESALVLDGSAATDSSYLETTLATSYALITPQGVLKHHLSNKPGRLPAPVQLKEIHTTESSDSVRTRYVVSTQTIRERYVPRFYKWCLVVALVVVLAGGVWGVKIVRRIF